MYQNEGRVQWLESHIGSNDKLIYLMQNEHGLFKIGISRDIERRRSELTLASGCSISVVAVYRPICQKARAVEAKLHNILARYRGIGEWFSFPATYSLDKFNTLCQRVGMEPYTGNRLPREDFVDLGDFAENMRLTKELQIERSKPYSANSVSKWRKRYGISK